MRAKLLALGQVNYEVEEESNGVKKTLFIDDYDAMDSEL